MLYPIPVAVKPIEDYQLLVTFKTGENRIYDMLYSVVKDCVKQVDKSKFLIFQKNNNDELILTEYNMLSLKISTS